MPILADQHVLGRFAEWLIAHAPTHSAHKLLRGVQTKSPVIGRHVMQAWENADDRQALRERLHQDFSTEEIAQIFAIAGAGPGDVTWSTSAMRQRRRLEALDDAAKRMGYATWRRLETAVINGDIRLTTERSA